MDSLDALPSVDYTSLLTISSPNERDGLQSLEADAIKTPQEHIYAQVTTNGPSQDPKPMPYQPKDKTKNPHHLDANANNILVCNTYVLKKPTVTHSSSIPDVKKLAMNSSSLCPKNSESLKTAKVHSKVTEPKSESSVFSISGRRVVVSSGFKGHSALINDDAKERESGLNSSNE